MRGGAVAFRSGDKAVADMAGFVSAKQGEEIDTVLASSSFTDFRYGAGTYMPKPMVSLMSFIPLSGILEPQLPASPSGVIKPTLSVASFCMPVQYVFVSGAPDSVISTSISRWRS